MLLLNKIQSNVQCLEYSADLANEKYNSALRHSLVKTILNTLRLEYQMGHHGDKNQLTIVVDSIKNTVVTWYFFSREVRVTRFNILSTMPIDLLSIIGCYAHQIRHLFTVFSAVPRSRFVIEGTVDVFLLYISTLQSSIQRYWVTATHNTYYLHYKTFHIFPCDACAFFNR